MSIISERVHHGEKILMDKSVFHDFLIEGAQLFLGWQLAPNHQVCDFNEAASFGKNFDRITSVLKDTLVSINVADG
jgi:hypothetical protein